LNATIIVERDAEADLAAAFRWYQEQWPGLGDEFLAEIDRCFARLTENPAHGARVARDARRILPRRFPYVVFYFEDGTQIRILAVLHQRRDQRLAHQRSIPGLGH
jgi:plasmid stabilization system protein ParE